MVAPFEGFTLHETSSALQLMGCAVITPIIVNWAFAESYLHSIHTAMLFSDTGVERCLC